MLEKYTISGRSIVYFIQKRNTVTDIKKLILEINSAKTQFFVKPVNTKEEIYSLSSSTGEDVKHLLTINKAENGSISTSFSVLSELKIENELVYAYVTELGVIQRYPLGKFLELI